MQWIVHLNYVFYMADKIRKGGDSVELSDEFETNLVCNKDKLYTATIILKCVRNFVK